MEKYVIKRRARLNFSKAEEQRKLFAETLRQKRERQSSEREKFSQTLARLKQDKESAKQRRILLLAEEKETRRQIKLERKTKKAPSFGVDEALVKTPRTIERKPFLKISKFKRTLSIKQQRVSKDFFVISAGNGLSNQESLLYISELRQFPDDVLDKKLEDFRKALAYVMPAGNRISEKNRKSYIIRVLRQGYESAPTPAYIIRLFRKSTATIFTNNNDFLDWLSNNKRNSLRKALLDPLSPTYKKLLKELEDIGKMQRGSLRAVFEANKEEIFEKLIELRMLLVEFGGSRHGQHAPIDGIVDMVNPRPHLVKVLRNALHYWYSKGILTTHSGKTFTYLANTDNPDNRIFRPDRN
ncbi:MAG: hypothetical protein Q7K42_00215 [Candidatus Diapherotrites archaeon]|nr:hypothetical protein [Candidatus Diapherotrites archaeon]